ncbi:MAG: hypothetical protein GKR91_08695 [Pseudomonadales bacterium]|nr:hypothetical protein [Pseudomonadales bacterium]
MNQFRYFAILVLLFTLSACDIVPVSVGVWDISIETDQGVRSATWTITEEPSLTITGTADLAVEEIDLAGSRITWSTEALDLPNSGPSERVNFRGTVDGNRLAGTVFTQQGNFSVNGTRQ